MLSTNTQVVGADEPDELGDGGGRLAHPRRAAEPSAWGSASSRSRNRAGWRSISSWSARWCSSTARGGAPTVPWLRYVTAGSSSQRSRSDGTERRRRVASRPQYGPERNPDRTGYLLPSWLSPSASRPHFARCPAATSSWRSRRARCREVIAGLEAQHAGFADRLLDEEGGLRKFVNIFVDDDDVRYLEGLDTKVADGLTVSIIPAVAGG